MSVIHHDSRDLRSFILFWFCRIFVKTLLRIVPISEGVLRRLSALDRWASRDTRPVPGVSVERTTVAGVPADAITPHRLDHPRVAVLYMHGGAFIACGLGTHRQIASAVARELGAPLVNIDYRQSPQVGVGTAVHDAYAVYRELRRSGDYDAIVVAGDSAGGYLAAKVIEYAARDGVAGPDAYIGFSPLLNLSPDAQRSSRHDALLPVTRLEELRPYYERGPESLDGNRDTTGTDVAVAFPPTVVIVAEGEALQKDALDLQASLNRVGVDNELHIYAGQIHAFPAAVIGSPQAKDAITLSAAFVRNALVESDREDAASA